MKIFVYVLKNVFSILLFTSFLMGCSESEKTLANKRTSEKGMIFYSLASYKVPPSYTGVCKLIIDGVKIEESTYTNGKRDGKTFCWYEDTGNIMSEHSFKDGILNGEAVKYDNHNKGAVLSKGVYKNNEPWDGSFLEAHNEEIDKNIIVEDQDTIYMIRKFKKGKFIQRCSSDGVIF